LNRSGEDWRAIDPARCFAAKRLASLDRLFKEFRVVGGVFQHLGHLAASLF
jgi:hypothetical protein